MNKIHPKQFRILAIATSYRGFGFAVLEGQNTLVDWGVRNVEGNKNAQSLKRVEELIAQYQPGVLVLQDIEDSRHSRRLKTLSRKIIAMAKACKVSVKLFSHEQLQRIYFGDGEGTKHALAEMIAKRFPEELGSRLPPKRKPWVSEYYQMDIFDAVALALAFRKRPVERK